MVVKGKWGVGECNWHPLGCSKTGFEKRSHSNQGHFHMHGKEHSKLKVDRGTRYCCFTHPQPPPPPLCCSRSGASCAGLRALQQLKMLHYLPTDLRSSHMFSRAKIVFSFCASFA